jgi:hypothetical protein
MSVLAGSAAPAGFEGDVCIHLADPDESRPPPSTAPSCQARVLDLERLEFRMVDRYSLQVRGNFHQTLGRIQGEVVSLIIIIPFGWEM